MALITRVSRLFRADMHAVLDHLEEPDVLLRQAIRDMEEQLTCSRDRVRLLERELVQLDSRDAQLRESVKSIDEQLDVCFSSDNDGLSRSLIRRQLETSRWLTALANRRESVQVSLGEMRDRLHHQDTVLAEMRQKAELLIDDMGDAGATDNWPAGPAAVCDADVEIAFLREKQKRGRS